MVMKVYQYRDEKAVLGSALMNLKHACVLLERYMKASEKDMVDSLQPQEEQNPCMRYSKMKGKLKRRLGSGVKFVKDPDDNNLTTIKICDSSGNWFSSGKLRKGDGKVFIYKQGKLVRGKTIDIK